MSGELIRILAICLIGAVLSVTLKARSGEYGLILSVATGVLIAFSLIRIIAPAVKSFDALLKEYGIGTEYLGVAFKAIGISYLTTFIADSCRDCGQSSLAAKAELAG